MTGQPDELTLCLASTSGGHLAELERVTEGIVGHRRFLVTVASPQSTSVMPGVPKRFVRRIVRNPANLLVNAIEALHILLKERPDVIVSTGAGDVVPLLVLGAALGIPTVFIESIARVHKPSTTGRIVRPLADLIMTPWASLEGSYPHAVHVATIAGPSLPGRTLPSSPKVLILTGTGTRGFNRLLQAVDRLVAGKALPWRVFAQVGESSYIPENYDHERYLSHPELTRAILDCDLVITHDGAGSMIESICAGKPTIVVPRRSEEGELTYNSEAELASHLASLGWVLVVENPAQIPEALSKLGQIRPTILHDAGRIPAEVLVEFLDSVARGERRVSRLPRTT